MVSKQCVMCGGYFSGELDGDYTCPHCQSAGVARRRYTDANPSPDQAASPPSAGKSNSQAA